MKKSKTVVLVEKWSKENGVARHQIRVQDYDEQPFEEMLILKDESLSELPYIKFKAALPRV